MKEIRPELRNLIHEYHLTLHENRIVRQIMDKQRNGQFSSTLISIDHYAWILNIITSREHLRTIQSPITILDVGAHLNLFSNFVNNLILPGGKQIHSTGLEAIKEYCDISDRIFTGNDMICGDVMDDGLLSGRSFDIILLCNFFHHSDPFFIGEIKNVFSAMTTALKKPGRIYCRMPEDDPDRADTLLIPCIEGDALPIDNFIPAGVEYSTSYIGDLWHCILIKQ